ncbi:hypothetical protein BJ322DRAFT_1172835 [Thelephora terrestris]|uniref:Uncharacterized protein n=1 Tax=Thelephora terrestris TaxID=56493 RepID=A0A9P6L1Q8_9AGAM|nr:hypothetical protein BJ322DRAFT_1172835 [Thelephora terrestris]
MRSRLSKETSPGLTQADRSHTSTSRYRLERSRFSPAAWLFVVLFAFLGLSFIISELHRFWYSRRSAAVNSVLSRFTSKPPLVDRTILEKIASLDLEDETNSNLATEFSIPIGIKSSDVVSPFHRPPRVTHLPEVQPQASLNLEMESQDRVCLEGNADHILSSCKFLLPLKIGDLAVNAHAHLIQLFELARALNRTLVLPTVGKNKVGVCRRWGFGVYYDEQAFSSKSSRGSNAVIRQDRFRTWVDSLASPPSTQVVFLDRTYPKNFPPVAVDEHVHGNLGISIYDNPDIATTLHRQTGCLNRKFPRLDLVGPFPQLLVVVDDRHKQESGGGDISKMLLAKLSEPTLTNAQSNPLTKTSDHSTDHDPDRAQISPDVLVVSWNIPIPIFQPYQIPTLRYSPQLRALAARLVRRLGPYIAVTWDVETSEADSILGCAEALRSTLHYVLGTYDQLGIRKIWLAGNLSPLDLVHSPELFCTSRPTEEFFTTDIKLTGVHQELEGMAREGEEVDDLANSGDEVARKQEVLNDAGILGILDKLVSMRSTIFVTASKSCGKTRFVLLSPR